MPQPTIPDGKPIETAPNAELAPLASNMPNTETIPLARLTPAPALDQDITTSLGLLHPQLLTLMMPLQLLAKNPEHRQIAVDEVLGLPPTYSLFCGFSFTFSLPVRTCMFSSLDVEFSLEIS